MKKIISLILAALILIYPMSIATFGEEEQVTLTFENGKSLNINEMVNATLIAPEGMEKAELFIENSLIYTVLGSKSAEHDITLDLSSAPVLGNTNIDIIVYMPEKIYGSVPVNLVRLKDEATVFSENFNTFTSGTWPSTVHGYIESANGSYVNHMGSYVHSDGDTALKVTFPAVYNKSSTYMEKDNIGLMKNCIALIKFDAYFSTDKEYMRVELRDSNGGYPQYGGAGVGSVAVFGKDSKLCEGEKTYSCGNWYSVLMEVDLSTNPGQESGGAWIYVKGGEYGDYTLIEYLSGFACDGLKKIRFTCSSAGGDNGYILIDNFEITKREFEKRWFYTAKYENANGEETAFDAVDSEGAKIILNLSEDMGDGLNGKVHITNEMGDSIKFSGTYNGEDKTYTATIEDKLLCGGKYFVKIDEGVLSNAGNAANSNVGTAFYAEAYPISVADISLSGGVVTVSINGCDLIEDGMALIIASYSGDKCTDSNALLLSQGTETYDVAVSKNSGEVIYAYIVDGFNTLNILSIYEL